jgi:putative hydrolase of the HAD superfamily
LPAAYAYHDVLSRMATILSLDPQSFISAFAVDTREARETGMYGSLSENIRDICSSLRHAITDDHLQAAVRVRRESIAAALTPRGDALPMLSTLRRRRLSVGLISDCCEVVPELWPGAELAPYVDAPIFSCKVGLRKPDPQIYRIACQALGVQPATCVYVGDGGSNELSGAARVGMHAVLLSVDEEQGVDPYRPDAETWKGRSISSLSELVDIV